MLLSDGHGSTDKHSKNRRPSSTLRRVWGFCLNMSEPHPLADRVLLFHFTDGAFGIFRLDLRHKELKHSSLGKLGLAGLINEVFDRPNSQKAWGEVNPKIDHGEVDCVWLFVKSDFYGFGRCDIEERNSAR
jgi:hypothetical protein